MFRIAIARYKDMPNEAARAALKRRDLSGTDFDAVMKRLKVSDESTAKVKTQLKPSAPK